LTLCVKPNSTHDVVGATHWIELKAESFNRAHASDGHLFRGRYKSILVDADSYLIELVRYIHRNP